MGVSAFLTMALCAFVRAQQDDSTVRERHLAMLACWAAVALATLSKGLIGLVIPGATLLIYTLWTRHWAIWRRLHPVMGMTLFLVIAAPWFARVSACSPEFAHFFFIHEHFQRYATHEAQRIGPWYFFIPILLVGLLPWSALLPGICWQGWQKQPAAQFQIQRLLLAWAGFVFVFFSISGSRLPAYILPMFPALAMLAAPLLPGMGKKTVWGIVCSLLLAGIAVLLAPLTWHRVPTLPVWPR
ncbi:Undecaprenyl phosphate-alpha-4-amino-4-deoxy-L-arabinose arabinosyl transferase [Andreprevotia sp. IGB-42]|nr:Undecaprenyl phosphate-alpha-4-amino-4-deoxy-L-arabinose arabinosyl transferase [Andreprevotia sp. IGB-42]